MKLLVVEDNDDLRNYLSTILNSNYTVITAENGLTGLQKGSFAATGLHHLRCDDAGDGRFDNGT